MSGKSGVFSTVQAREQFHPGRREHADTFIAALGDTASQKYAAQQLDHIWSKKPAPKKPRALSAIRVRELDTALYAIFATVR